MDWIDLAQGRDEWRALGKRVAAQLAVSRRSSSME
jgi:hypothetical protein